MSCEKRFVEMLRERGFRLTPQREMVLAVLHNIDGFSTADEIYALVQERSRSVDISTVYRTLELLEDLRLVAHLDGEDGQRCYELLGVHGVHHHLRCTQCSQVIPLDHEEIAPLLARIASEYGFAVAPASRTFYGLCAMCQTELETKEVTDALLVPTNAHS